MRSVAAALALTILAGQVESATQRPDLDIDFERPAAGQVETRIGTRDGGDGTDTGAPQTPGGCEWRRALAHDLIDPGFLHTLIDYLPGQGWERAVDGDTHRYYVRTCGAADEITHGTWAPTRPAGDAELLARQARSLIVAPVPDVRLAPPAVDAFTLPGLPTWIWVAPEQWQPIDETASIPGLAVTTTATPVTLSWVTADTVGHCEGPGVPYSRAAGSSPCTHTYIDAGRWPLQVTVVYDVTWATTDGARSGTLEPLEAVTVVEVTVRELQAHSVRD